MEGHMDEGQLQALFMKVFGENISNAYKAVEGLEQDMTNSAEIENLHRFFHSLKSESLMMKYESQGKKAKEHEDYLYDVMHNTKLLDAENLHTMKSTLESFQVFLSTLDSHKSLI